jgi:altronate dehydratase
VASAVVNMSQQIGAALGLAMFTTVAVSSSNERLPEAALVLQEASSQDLVAEAAAALSHGYTTAFATGAAMLLAAAIVTMVAVNTRHTQASHPASVY